MLFGCEATAGNEPALRLTVGNARGANRPNFHCDVVAGIFLLLRLGSRDGYSASFLNEQLKTTSTAVEADRKHPLRKRRSLRGAGSVAKSRSDVGQCHMLLEHLRLPNPRRQVTLGELVRRSALGMD